MKVKIFVSGFREELEKDVNDWFLINDNVRIQNICQSESLSNGDGGITISIFYI